MRSGHYYSGGGPYLGLCGRGTGTFPGPLRATGPTVEWTPSLDWPQFWSEIQRQLKNHDYGRGTLLLYRQVLRQFRDHCARSPSSITPAIVRGYIDGLVQEDSTWSWVATNISVLRLAFDKIGGQHLTNRLVTPKRGRSLPVILSQHEANRVLNSAPTIRDQLLLGLVYGCGLRVSELCTIRWGNIEIANKRLTIHSSRQSDARSLQLPPALCTVLEKGLNVCQSTDYIFPGRNEGSHLSERMVQLIVRKAARTAGIGKTVSCMTLRHSYAVHRLEAGDSIPAVQQALGHRSVNTTILYQNCILPKNVQSPLAAIRQMGTAASLPSMPGPTQLPLSPYLLVEFRHAALLEALRLPFRDDSQPGLCDRAAEFLQSLKTQITNRFLAPKGGRPPPG